MADVKTPDATRNGLAEFFNVAEQFISGTLEAIAGAVGNDDDAPLIESHSGALREQFGNLSQYVQGQYERANAEVRREIDDVMRVQAVSTLARNGDAAFRRIAAAGTFGSGTFSWVESVAQEIKKLVEFVLGQLNLPDWVRKLIQVIDQILKAVLGLFAGALGRNRAKVMSELSAMEVEFWNELAAQRRFVAVRRAERTQDEE